MVKQKKYIFVTGGVLSSIGKGISASSIGLLLEKRGIKVTMIKMDPYLNVDPGTKPAQRAPTTIASYMVASALRYGYHRIVASLHIEDAGLEYHANGIGS